MINEFKNGREILRKFARSSRNRFILSVTLGYALFASLWFLGFHHNLFHSINPATIDWMNRLHHIAFIIVTVMLLFLALRTVPIPTSLSRGETYQRPWSVLITLLVLTIILILIEILGFHSLNTSWRIHEMDALNAIARIKASTLSTWLEERRGDTLALARNPTLRAALGGWLKYSDTTDRDQIMSLLEGVRSRSNYTRVALVDDTGHILLDSSARPATPLPDHLMMVANQTFRTGTITLVDLYRRPSDNIIQMGYMAPISSTGGGHMPALIFLEIQANSYLFPFIQSWPLSSATGETLLIRREGEEIVYLNDLRLQQGTALNARQSLNISDSIATQALHVQGSILGRDYRQIAVLGAAQLVPETPWTIITKIDEEELLSASHTLVWIIGSLTFISLIIASIFIFLILRQQRLRIAYNEMGQVRALESAERRFRSTFEQVAVGLALLSPDGHWIRFNQRLCEIVGYTRLELPEKTFRDLISPDDHSHSVAVMERLLTGAVPHDHWEQRCRRPEGTEIWIAITASLTRDAAGRPEYFIVVIQDITTKQEAEEELRRLRSLSGMMSTPDEFK